MAMQQGDNSLMEQIRVGMAVVDAQGEKVGTVDFVRMADTQAAEIEETPDGAPGEALLDLLDPDNDDRVTERMLQRGYVKIDADGIFAGDKYVLSDDVAAVEGDTVRLAKRKDAIADPA